MRFCFCVASQGMAKGRKESASEPSWITYITMFLEAQWAVAKHHVLKIIVAAPFAKVWVICDWQHCVR